VVGSLERCSFLYGSGKHQNSVKGPLQGPGIPRELRSRVLKPFFTTKELKDTGLGLWLANSLVMNRGTLRFRSRRASGGAATCFRIFLPIGAPSDFGQRTLILASQRGQQDHQRRHP
jgi:hypothetical protein